MIFSCSRRGETACRAFPWNLQQSPPRRPCLRKGRRRSRSLCLYEGEEEGLLKYVLFEIPSIGLCLPKSAGFSGRGSVTGERLGGGCRLSSLTTAQAINSAPCVRRLPACETDIRVGFSAWALCPATLPLPGKTVDTGEGSLSFDSLYSDILFPEYPPGLTKKPPASAGGSALPATVNFCLSAIHRKRRGRSSSVHCMPQSGLRRNRRIPPPR